MHSHIIIRRFWSQGNVVDFELGERRIRYAYGAATIVIYRWGLMGRLLGPLHLTLTSLHLILLLVAGPDEIFFDWSQVAMASLSDARRFV